MCKEEQRSQSLTQQDICFEDTDGDILYFPPPTNPIKRPKSTIICYSSVLWFLFVVQKRLKTRQWAALLHKMTCSFITMNTVSQNVFLGPVGFVYNIQTIENQSYPFKSPTLYWKLSALLLGYGCLWYPVRPLWDISPPPWSESSSFSSPPVSSVEHIVGNLVMQLLLGIPLELVHKGFEVGMVYMAGVLAGHLFFSYFISFFKCGLCWLHKQLKLAGLHLCLCMPS